MSSSLVLCAQVHEEAIDALSIAEYVSKVVYQRLRADSDSRSECYRLYKDMIVGVDLFSSFALSETAHMSLFSSDRVTLSATIFCTACASSIVSSLPFLPMSSLFRKLTERCSISVLPTTIMKLN